MRRALALVAVMGSLFGLALAKRVEARSDAERLTLEWRAPAECPDAAWMHAEIAQLVGAEDSATPAPVIAARGVVEGPSRKLWRVVLRTVQGDLAGERVLEAETCQELAHAAAVVLALAIHSSSNPLLSTPGDAATALPTDAADGGIADGAASYTRVDHDASAPSARELEASPRLVVGAAVAGDVGTFPSPALGASLALGAELGRLRIVAIGTYWPRARGDAPSSSAGGTLSLLAAGARVCYALLAARVELAPCAGAELGSMRGAGFGVDQTRTEQATWLAATANGIALWHALDRWALRVELGAAFPMTRDRFVLTGIGAINRPGAIVGRFEIGFDLLF